MSQSNDPNNWSRSDSPKKAKRGKKMFITDQPEHSQSDLDMKLALPADTPTSLPVSRKGAKVEFHDPSFSEDQQRIMNSSSGFQLEQPAQMYSSLSDFNKTSAASGSALHAGPTQATVSVCKMDPLASTSPAGYSGYSRKRTGKDACLDDYDSDDSDDEMALDSQQLKKQRHSSDPSGAFVDSRPPEVQQAMQNVLKANAPKAGKKTKGRVRIAMNYIENKLKRLTTFSKRKTGIMKKAFELSTLTGTQVMLLVASETGHVYTFATRKLQPMITSEAGKGLIQTCLNSPEESQSVVQNLCKRMDPMGYEETDLGCGAEEQMMMSRVRQQSGDSLSMSPTGALQQRLQNDGSCLSPSRHHPNSPHGASVPPSLSYQSAHQQQSEVHGSKPNLAGLSSSPVFPPGPHGADYISSSHNTGRSAVPNAAHTSHISSRVAFPGQQSAPSPQRHNSGNTGPSDLRISPLGSASNQGLLTPATSIPSGYMFPHSAQPLLFSAAQQGSVDPAAAAGLLLGINGSSPADAQVPSGSRQQYIAIPVPVPLASSAQAQQLIQAATAVAVSSNTGRTTTPK